MNHTYKYPQILSCQKLALEHPGVSLDQQPGPVLGLLLSLHDCPLNNHLHHLHSRRAPERFTDYAQSRFIYLTWKIFLDENGNLEFPLIVYLIELLDNFVTIFFSAEFITRLIICPRNSVLFKNIKTNNIKQNFLNLYN